MHPALEDETSPCAIAAVRRQAFATVPRSLANYHLRHYPRKGPTSLRFVVMAAIRTSRASLKVCVEVNLASTLAGAS